MKRIFTALPVPELESAVLVLKDKYPHMGVRWLTGKNLHVTLIPPWYEEDPQNAFGMLEKAGGAGEIELHFVKISFGPDPRRPRLIWAEAEHSEMAEELKKLLENSFGKENESRRPWKVHCTLARFREEDFGGFGMKKLDEIIDIWVNVKTAVLMESHLSSSGADYEIIKEVKL